MSVTLTPDPVVPCINKNLTRLFVFCSINFFHGITIIDISLFLINVCNIAGIYDHIYLVRFKKFKSLLQNIA